MEQTVPIWHKELLTIDESVKLFNIGRRKIEEILEESPDLALRIGNKKRLVKKDLLKKYLMDEYSI